VIRTIYFAGSISGGRGDADLYRQIIRLLSEYGQVLTEHVGDPQLTSGGETRRSGAEVYRQDMDWLAQADVLVAEVTMPSHGVGYEIASAERMGKPVLCLHRSGTGRRLSAMLGGNPALQCERYASLEEVEAILQRFFGS